MAIGLQTLLLVVALICFILAALSIPSRVNLTALGLGFLTAAMLFAGVTLT